jgi:hypothetical protein
MWLNVEDDELVLVRLDEQMLIRLAVSLTIRNPFA